MPRYVAHRAADLLNLDGKPINGSSILLLGVTYKANIADQRESPATPVAREGSLHSGRKVRVLGPIRL